MPYKPTGNPPGRPRKTPLPEVAPKPESASISLVEAPLAPPDRPWDSRDMSKNGVLCPTCYPDGLGPVWHSAGCEHGVWFKV